VKSQQVRKVIVTADTVLAILKDYLGPDNLPEDAQVVKVLVNAKERGKLALVVDSLQWKEGLPPMAAEFDIRRVYSVGGRS